MSGRASWQSSRALSRDRFESESDDETIEPTFEEPEHFARCTGKGGWYCTICALAEHPHLHSFSPVVAMNHEKTQSHKDNVVRFTTWEPTGNWGIDVDNWGPSKEPFDQLRASTLSRVIPLQKRIKRWMRDIAKAEGLEFEEDEDLDVDDPPYPDWDQWGAGGEDWKRPVEEWGFPPGGPPPPDPEPDPQWSADYRFVEKVARKRGLKNDRRRLHAFYRLPTDEKISRIQEIVRFIHTH